MKVYGQLERAQLEPRTTDHATALLGALWIDTVLDRVRISNGTIVKSFLLNDDKIIVGTNGTAANNVRVFRAANALLQFVPGNDTTAEGTLSTTLAQVSLRLENHTTLGRPNFGNAGRVIYNSDDLELQVDTGSSWTSAGGGGGSDQFELLRQKFHSEAYGVLTPPIAYSFGSGFGLPDQEPQGQIIEDYTAGTVVAVVWNPVYLNESDKNCDTTSNFTALAAATNLTTTATFKIGSAALVFDKDNSDTNARVQYDRGSVNLNIAGFTELFFWIKLPSLTQLVNIEVRVDVDNTNYETYTTTTDHTGAALVANWNLIKIDLAQAGVSAGTGWTYAQAFRYLHIGVNTTVNAQTYAGIIVDAIRFSLENPSDQVFLGNVYSINDTSNLADFQIDAASARVAGTVTLTNALGAAFTGGTDSQVRRNTLEILGNGQAFMEDGLSGAVSTSQVVRSQFVYDQAVTKSYRAFADVNTPLTFRVTDVMSSTQIKVSSSVDFTAELVNGVVLHVFQKKNKNFVRRDVTPGDLTITSSSFSAPKITINTGTNTGIAVGDYIAYKHISSRLSVVGIDDNEDLQAPTLEKVLMYDVGLPYTPDTWANWSISDGDATLNRKGAGPDLTQAGTLTDVPFLNGELGTAGYSGPNHWAVGYTDSLPISGDIAQCSSLLVSVWFLATTFTGSPRYIISRYGVAAATNWGWAIVEDGFGNMTIAANNATPAIGTISLNVWHNVIYYMENSGGVIKVWKDGALVLDTTASITDTGGLLFYIGYYDGAPSGAAPGPASNMSIAQPYIRRNLAAAPTQSFVDAIWNGGAGRPLGFASLLSYQYSLPGTNGQKGTFEASVNRTTDAVSIYLGAEGALTVS